MIMRTILFPSFLAIAQQLPSFEIAPGVHLPAVSCGHPDDTPTSNCTHGLGPGCNITAMHMVELWLSPRIQGSGIDTAFGYDNQQGVGAGIRNAVANGSIASRDSVFITTKVNPHDFTSCTADAAVAAVKVDLAQLGVSRLDLVLQHFPCNTDAENAAVWSGLMQAQKMNLTRAIGVSHYKVTDLEALAKAGLVLPSVLQNSMCVGSHDDETITWCEEHGVTFEAYGALRSVDFSNPKLVAIAQTHGVSLAQVALRWVTQFGKGHPLAVSPGTNVEYMTEDLNLGAFTLSEAEMTTLSAI